MLAFVIGQAFHLMTGGGGSGFTPVDSGIIVTILQSAGAGTAIIVILLLLGILSPRSLVQRLEKEVSDWQAAYNAERSARVDGEKALAAERQRAEAAVETAKIATEVLDGLRGRTHGLDPRQGSR